MLSPVSPNGDQECPPLGSTPSHAGDSRTAESIAALSQGAERRLILFSRLPSPSAYRVGVIANEYTCNRLV